MRNQPGQVISKDVGTRVSLAIALGLLALGVKSTNNDQIADLRSALETNRSDAEVINSHNTVSNVALLYAHGDQLPENLSNEAILGEYMTLQGVTSAISMQLRELQRTETITDKESIIFIQSAIESLEEATRIMNDATVAGQLLPREKLDRLTLLLTHIRWNLRNVESSLRRVLDAQGDISDPETLMFVIALLANAINILGLLLKKKEHEDPQTERKIDDYYDQFIIGDDGEVIPAKIIASDDEFIVYRTVDGETIFRRNEKSKPEVHGHTLGESEVDAGEIIDLGYDPNDERRRSAREG